MSERTCGHKFVLTSCAVCAAWLANVRTFREAPRPWSVTPSTDGNHELVDANGAPIAQSPMFGWLRTIAELVNGA